MLIWIKQKTEKQTLPKPKKQVRRKQLQPEEVIIKPTEFRARRLLDNSMFLS
jgi:hypothetical protein